MDALEYNADDEFEAACLADDEPRGTCVLHGDYWTDDCVRCRGYAFPADEPNAR